MKYKIGVFGSAVDENKETQEKVKQKLFLAVQQKS